MGFDIFGEDVDIDSSYYDNISETEAARILDLSVGLNFEDSMDSEMDTQPLEVVQDAPIVIQLNDDGKLPCIWCQKRFKLGSGMTLHLNKGCKKHPPYI